MIDWGLLAQRLTWQSIADVAILTLVAFRVYLWLRGTVALQVLAGMGALVLAAVITSEAGLLLTTYVLQAVGAVAALAAVVVFQVEIRRALRRVDPRRWLRRRRAGEPNGRSRYQELASGLLSLADKRIGALIILSRADEVSEHLTGGAVIDGRVTPELLEAIFHRGSPIHDGAALIHGSRIELAGAFLPLSTAGDLPEHHGTRHRAAVGLSESCDAVVLAVSEERGEVSVASGGRIARAPASAEPLAERIAAAMRSPDSAGRAATETGGRRVGARGRWRGRDAAAFAVILTVVTGAWFALAGDRSTMITQRVPVELRGSPSGARVDVLRPDSGEIAVRLRGPRRLLFSRARSEVTAYVQLAGLEPGRHALQVKTSGPPGVDVVGAEPAEVVLRLLAPAAR